MKYLITMLLIPTVKKSSKKKILLLGPIWFSLTSSIKKEIEKKGFEVVLRNERVSESSFIKLIVRFKIPILYKFISDKFYNELLKEIHFDKFEKIILINPECIPLWFIAEAKKKIPDIRMYLWDSLEIKKHPLRLIKFCNKVFTFDLNESKKFKINYLPLFYENQQLNLHEKIKYDFVFIGSLHSDRIKKLAELKKIFDQERFSYFIYIYVPSFLYFFRYSYDLINYGLFMKEHIKTQPIEKQNMYTQMLKSKAIIDLSYFNQCGLSLRIFEAASISKKIVSNNNNLKNISFYDPRNHLILDDDLNKNSLKTFLANK